MEMVGSIDRSISNFYSNLSDYCHR